MTSGQALRSATRVVSSHAWLHMSLAQHVDLFREVPASLTIPYHFAPYLRRRLMISLAAKGSQPATGSSLYTCRLAQRAANPSIAMYRMVDSVFDIATGAAIGQTLWHPCSSEFLHCLRCRRHWAGHAGRACTWRWATTARTRPPCAQAAIKNRCRLTSKRSRNAVSAGHASLTPGRPQAVRISRLRTTSLAGSL